MTKSPDFNVSEPFVQKDRANFKLWNGGSQPPTEVLVENNGAVFVDVFPEGSDILGSEIVRADAVIQFSTGEPFSFRHLQVIEYAARAIRTVQNR